MTEARVTMQDTFTASCSGCRWHYSTGEHMIRDYEAARHKCYQEGEISER